MRCLFCKTDSSTSRSREHILPESLGNKSHVLPPGAVCDRCNNYFSRKVEKPFLETPSIIMLRFREALPSKRGIIPPIPALLPPRFPAILRKEVRQAIPNYDLFVPPEAIPYVLSGQCSSLYAPAYPPLPSGAIVSRFLAKAGLEALAARIVNASGGIEYLCDEVQLDPVRNHARRGTDFNWPFHVRRIYKQDCKWADEHGRDVQVLHEFDILVTDNSEYYFVLAIFGLEFALNLGGAEIEGYHQWLAHHGGKSPLFSGKNVGNLGLTLVEPS